MKIYSKSGFNDFIIYLVYKVEMIKKYFSNYASNNSDLSINLKTNKTELFNDVSETGIKKFIN